MEIFLKIECTNVCYATLADAEQRKKFLEGWNGLSFKGTINIDKFLHKTRRAISSISDSGGGDGNDCRPHIDLNCKFILTRLGGFGSRFALAAYCNSSQGGIDISSWVTEQLSSCPSIEKVKFYTVKLFAEVIYRNYAGWV